jgi:hypothetical protein
MGGKETTSQTPSDPDPTTATSGTSTLTLWTPAFPRTLNERFSKRAGCRAALSRPVCQGSGQVIVLRVRGGRLPYRRDWCSVCLSTETACRACGFGMAGRCSQLCVCALAICVLRCCNVLRLWGLCRACRRSWLRGQVGNRRGHHHRVVAVARAIGQHRAGLNWFQLGTVDAAPGAVAPGSRGEMTVAAKFSSAPRRGPSPPSAAGTTRPPGTHL